MSIKNIKNIIYIKNYSMMSQKLLFKLLKLNEIYIYRWKITKVIIIIIKHKYFNICINNQVRFKKLWNFNGNLNKIDFFF
jgi:hypothetical protein